MTSSSGRGLQMADSRGDEDQGTPVLVASVTFDDDNDGEEMVQEIETSFVNIVPPGEDVPNAGGRVHSDTVTSFDILQSDPTADAIAECDKYVLRPYRFMLRVLGWIPFSRHGSRLLKVPRWLYVAALNVILLTTFACQIAICYRRDGFVFTGLMSNASTITCEGEDHIVTNSVFQDGLLLASYWFGVYLFSGRGDSEHLFSLASRTVLKYYQLEDTKEEKKAVRSIIALLIVYFLFGLVWTVLSFTARLIQAFGLGLFPGEYTLVVLWGGVASINPTASIILGVLCLAGFVLFDLVYLAAVINYAVQSEFNIGFLRAITQLVQQRKYPNLDTAINDIGESKKYLNLLNGKTAFSVALVIFNIGSAAVIGLWTLNRLTMINLETTTSYAIGLVSVGLGTTLWISLIFFPLLQAARVTAACRVLLSSAPFIRTRPFHYIDTSQLELDSYTIHSLAVNMRAKLFGVPIYPWVMYGALTAILFVGLILIETDSFSLFSTVV